MKGIQEEKLSQKILIIVGDGGESFETWFAKHRFEEAGFKVVVAAPEVRRLHLVIHDFEPGWDTYKERSGYVMASDVTFEQVVVKDYFAVVCIGGRSPEYLRNNPKVISILQEFDKLEKWIWALCHGVQLPAAAGLVKGKRVTCYEHVRLEVETCGGTYVKEKAVRDGRLVTCPTWVEHPEFYQLVFQCIAESNAKK
jgi:protease I